MVVWSCHPTGWTKPREAQYPQDVAPWAQVQPGPASGVIGSRRWPILAGMESRTPSRRPRTRPLRWSPLLVAALVNVPLLLSLATDARLSAGGDDVTAEVVGGRVHGEEADPEYWLSYRFDAEVDEEREVWSAEVGRTTYARARETRELAVRVVPDQPAAHRVEGARPRRLGRWLTLGADAVLVVIGAVWWARRRADPEPAPAAEG